MNAPHPAPSLTKNVTRLSHLDLQGAGQVYVDGNYAYVGHITNKEGLATSILDVSDPKHPKLLAQLPVGDKVSHSHKARVIGDVMIVNMRAEHDRDRSQGRRAAQAAASSCARRSVATPATRSWPISSA